MGVLPATTIVAPVHFALMGTSTALVTPCSVRFPAAVALTSWSLTGGDGSVMGAVSVKVASGNFWVSRPRVPMAASRRASSLLSLVVSALISTAGMVAPATVIVPVTVVVRPVAVFFTV
jgi:hypothetical protein